MITPETFRSTFKVYAIQLVGGSEPFALMIRHRNGEQVYLPSVTNASRPRL